MHYSNRLKIFVYCRHIHFNFSFLHDLLLVDYFHQMHCFVNFLHLSQCPPLLNFVVRMSSSTVENPSRSHEAKLTLSILRTHSDKGKSSSSSSVVATLHSISVYTFSWIITAWRKQFRIVLSVMRSQALWTNRTTSNKFTLQTSFLLILSIIRSSANLQKWQILNLLF